MQRTHDITGIGNAIVDILAHVEHDFIEKHGLPRAGMTLIDEARAAQIYADMPPARECSGGSAANTLAGMAMLGCKAAFIGKVKNDQLGQVFRHDMRSIGIEFDSTPLEQSQETTARCYVSVTPDGERTMATYLGVAAEITPADVRAAPVATSRILYIEGYMWDRPDTISTIRGAIETAKSAGVEIAFTLSDLFCVERHRSAFLGLVEQDLDILFANEAEICGLYQVQDVQQAMKQLQGKVTVGVVTCSEKGAYVITAEDIMHIPTQPVSKVVDATGAGDLFAAGFLYGYVSGKSLREAAGIGHACARQIIQQLGARPEVPLTQLVA